LSRQIRTIDCRYIREGVAAAYLVHEEGEGYFVEANTYHALPYQMKAMEDERIEASNIRWIAITHVHLDHSGGAFALLDKCPNAQILAHPRAARHLINPEKLVASARQVYGDRLFRELYGEIGPVPAERVRIVEDGEEILFHGSTLRCIHTRGHANHHFCLLDPVLKGIFTGDSFGLAYPALQRNGLFIFPSSSPTDFDPEAAMETLETVMNSGAERVFLTHFGEMTDLSTARAQLGEFLELSARLYYEAKSCDDGFDLLSNRFEGALRELFAKVAGRVGLSLNGDDWELLATDLRLNADGIAFAGIRAREEKR
jgi:glyoxylase-like metal-dependent hydrolase (beta-lactamase superfamily II)